LAISLFTSPQFTNPPALARDVLVGAADWFETVH